MTRLPVALVISVAAASGLAVTTIGAAQSPDLFTCTEPARLATGTFLYQTDDNPGRPHLRRTISRLDAGGRPVVRLTWSTPTPSEHVTDLDGTSLALIRHTTNRTSPAGTPQSSSLEILDGRARGRLTPASSPVSIATGGRQVAFGPYAMEVLAAAVNWEQCSEATAGLVTQRGIETVALSRADDETLQIQGRGVEVFSVDLNRVDASGRVWISRAAPHVVVKFRTVGGGTFSLARRE